MACAHTHLLVYTLRLYQTRVADASALGAVHTLDLRETYVIDLSMLQNIQHLLV